jgi:hypothetical protein
MEDRRGEAAFQGRLELREVGCLQGRREEVGLGREDQGSRKEEGMRLEPWRDGEEVVPQRRRKR